MCGDIILWLGSNKNNKLNVNVGLVYGPFLAYEWAVFDVAVGHLNLAVTAVGPVSP